MKNKNISDGILKYNKSHPERYDFTKTKEYREKRKRIAIEIGKDPEIRKKRRVIMKEKWKEEEYRKKVTKSLIEKNVGRKASKTTRKKQKLAKLGKKETPEIREIKRLAAIKRWANPEYHKKQKLAIKNAKRTYVMTEEHKRHLKENRPDFSGKNNPMYNKGYLLEGKRNGMYKDGSSIKYPYAFNKDLRRKVRERDNYICQQCFKKQNKRQLAVHHIDGNKKNNNINNLVSLCQSCHQKIHIQMLFHNIFFKKIYS